MTSLSLSFSDRIQDKKSDLVISTYVDVIMEKVLKRLGVELPPYDESMDPTHQSICDLEWTIPSEQVKTMEKLYDDKLKASSAKRRKPITSYSEWTDDKKKFKKLSKKEE